MATYLDSSDEEDYVFEIETEERPETEAFVNDEEGLKEKLQEFRWPTDLPFSEAQDVTAEQEDTVEDANDDLERELSFYNQALGAAKHGMHVFEKEGEKWLRPEDYYAEMVKSDSHMARIKDQLLYEQKRIALAEERRKTRDAKKFAKQVQAARQQEKQTSKKQKTKQIQNLRTQRKRMGFGQEFDWDMALDEVHQQEKQPKRKRANPQKDVKSGKRMYKDARYGRSGGFGAARNRKGNTEDSAGDMSLYRPRSIEKKTKRLGKNRRSAKISKRNSKM